MPPSRLNPTLFDKLSSATEMGGLRQGEDPATQARGEVTRAALRHYAVPNIDRFNENAMRATVRRDLAWLLNTVNLASGVDLTPYPHVRTSVLNYGVEDLTGKALTTRAVQDRADKIRAAIRAFEPRMDERSLVVERQAGIERQNALTFVIRGDISSAVQAMPVRFSTDVEVDTGATTVRD